MIQEYIFKKIKDNVAEILASDGTYHVYPAKVPEGVIFDNAVTYTRLSSPIRYGVTLYTVQVTITSKDIDTLGVIENKIINLFSDQIYSEDGDPISSNVTSVSSLPYDEEVGYFASALTITLKSKKY